MSFVGRTVRKCMAVALDLADRLTGYSPETVGPEGALARNDVLIRWGDGESSLAVGRSTSFQPASPPLARELRRLLRTRDPRITLCLPGFLLSGSPFAGRDDRFRRIWLLTTLLMRIWARRGVYGDSFLFRNEANMNGLDPLVRLLRRARRVIVVSPDSFHADTVRSMCPGAQVQHLSVLPRNAYAERDVVKRGILALGKPDVLLLSAGPTGKCLAPELLTYWDADTKIVDTGNLFDHLLQRGDCK